MDIFTERGVMRYIVDISPEMVDIILKEIEKGAYRSVQEFIINSVQNQIYLIDTPSQSVASIQSIRKDERAQNESINYLVLEKSDIATVEPNKEKIQPLLSGFWNKFFPVKITVRVLSALQREHYDSIQLALLQEQASIEARSIGLTLVKSEKKSGRKRGDRLFTGLPVKRNDEKSRSRFKSHFVGNLSRNGIYGMPGTLHLIDIYIADDGKEYVRLTGLGKEFSDFKNPILDDKNYNDSLSIEEREFLIQLIKKHLPEEYSEMLSILKCIAEGNTSGKELNQEISLSKPNLSENQINTELSGILNRLVDLNLLNRSYEGLSYLYELSEKGKNLLEVGNNE